MSHRNQCMSAGASRGYCKQLVSLIAVLSVFTGIDGYAQNADPNAIFQQLSTSDGSSITHRHESGSLVINNKLYAFGGRQMKPVEVFDPTTNSWTTLGTPPWEINHFQPVFHNGLVYAIGAFECCYPDETIHPNILIYDPSSDNWSIGPAIPANRLRGSGGAVVHNNKIYFVGGNTDGHSGGAVAWFDEFDPATNSWQTLADAPNARDHFFAVLIGSKLVAATGRQSAQPDPFINTVSAVDVYDFNTGQWSTAQSTVPTDRAGAMAVGFGEEAIFIGGEISGQTAANNEVEAFNALTGVWRVLQPLLSPTHTGVAGVLGNELHVISGSDTVGGGGENGFHQVALLDDGIPDPLDADADGLTDSDEINVYSTNRLKADTDDDGLADGVEINVHGTDPNKVDSDDDGLSDFDEVNRGTSPMDVDSDSDSLSDGDEVTQYNTNPLKSDSDEDFLPDSQEVLQHGTNPNNADSDGDLLTDAQEINEYSTNAMVSDTDGDGLADGAEVHEHGTNPSLADTDGDGINDGLELSAGMNPLDGGTNGGNTAGGNGSTGGGSDGSGSTTGGMGSTGGGSDGNSSTGGTATTGSTATTGGSSDGTGSTGGGTGGDGSTSGGTAGGGSTGGSTTGNGSTDASTSGSSSSGGSGSSSGSGSGGFSLLFGFLLLGLGRMRVAAGRSRARG